MYIYKIENAINHKVYIGQTIRPVEERFQRHINDACNNILDTHFARAIRKYGADNFSVEIIDTAETQDDLNFKEQYWIRFYDSVRYGYNETDAIFKCGGNTYISKTQQELMMIRTKLRDSKIGSRNPNSKKIKCLDTFSNNEVVFDTVKECQEYFNEANHRFVTTRANHQTKSLYLDRWDIAYINDDYKCFRKADVHKKGRHVEVINQNNVMEFDSIRLACRELRLSYSKFNKGLKGSPNGFYLDGYYIKVS